MSDTQKEDKSINDKIPKFLRNVLSKVKDKQKDSTMRYGVNIMISKIASPKEKSKSEEEEEDIDDSINYLLGDTEIRKTTEAQKKDKVKRKKSERPYDTKEEDIRDGTYEEEEEEDKDEEDKDEEEEKEENKKDEDKKDYFYLSNRSEFVSFINKRLEEAKKEYLIENNGKSNPSLQLQQQLITNYINLDTPYRGLLLYHGLGSGKTISSIAVAEGISSFNNNNNTSNNSNRPEIIVIGPLQLSVNFTNEIRKYYDKMGMSLDPNFKPTYYGYTSSKDMRKLIKEKENGIEKDKDPSWWNNKIVIIDEVHNLSNRILNALKKKKDSPNTSADPLGIITLYENMKKATNTRFILLSGTPVVNQPVELAVIFNILRGYIKTYEFTFRIPTKKSNNYKKLKDSIEKRIEKIHDVDFFNVVHKNKSRSGTNKEYKVVVTQNPMMPLVFENEKTDVYKKFKPAQDTDEHDFHRKIIGTISNFLGKDKMDTDNEIKMEEKKYTALPDDKEEFNDMFSNIINEKNDEKSKVQSDMFKRRIIGLASYFKKASSMAELNEEDIYLEMSEYQLRVYNQEVLKEKDNSKGKGRKQKVNQISNESYKVFTRQTCDFALPAECATKEKDDKKYDLAISPVGEEDRREDIDTDTQPTKEGEAQKETYVPGEDNKKEEIIQCMKDINNKQNGQFLKIDPTENEDINQLGRYSPKYKYIIEQLLDPRNKGLHLIYSGFVVRGTDLLGFVLKQNGFIEMEISESKSKVEIKNIDKVKDNKNRVFLMYRTSDSGAIKEAKRFIYNNTWNDVLLEGNNKYEDMIKQLKSLVVQNSFNQKKGDIVKAMLITKSSSEGISLNNTRFVHIIDPYWNPSVTQQVIGRARRFGSHDTLDKSEQNIKVFKYFMEIKKQKDGMKSKDSTDVVLKKLSEGKLRVMNRFLDMIKSASVDCKVNKIKGEEQENYKCMVFNESKEWTYGPNIDEDKGL